MKLFTWNVNGIRSVFQKTFREWLAAEDPDIVCIQETKADASALADEFHQLPGYYSYFNSSRTKKGYSGVAVYSKAKANAVCTEFGHDRFDGEGRGLHITFDNFSLFNFYIPNGSGDKKDIPYKLEVYEHLTAQLSKFSNTPTIIVGDFNVARSPLDVIPAELDEDHTMYTPAERAALESLLSTGYTDSYRHLHPEDVSYTWWPYGLPRKRNEGWRIDYTLVSAPLVSLLREVSCNRKSEGSDHAPVCLEIDLPLPDSPPAVHHKRQLDLFD